MPCAIPVRSPTAWRTCFHPVFRSLVGRPCPEVTDSMKLRLFHGAMGRKLGGFLGHTYETPPDV